VYRFIDHTAELGLELEAESEEEIFAEALSALAELIACGGEGDAAPHEIELTAPDRAVLLADWLEELVFLAETEGFVPSRIQRLDLGERTLRARVEGRTGSPRHLVKAVTHHGLEFAATSSGFRAKLVLDV
jgi:SHS2 domain-containing protein